MTIFYGFMHLVTTTTVPPFHCLFVSSCRYVIMKPCNRVTITPCHSLHHFTVPFVTNMQQPCCRETWCENVPPRATVTPACNLVQKRTTVPPGAFPCHLVRHHATVPLCRFLTGSTHLQIYGQLRT